MFIKKRGITKEVAVGTVIQDQQHATLRASHAGIDSNVRTSLKTVPELRTQGYFRASSRQRAQGGLAPPSKPGACGTTPFDICPHVADFFQSGPGLAFLHRLVIAFHLVCVEVGACGIRLVVSLSSPDRH